MMADGRHFLFGPAPKYSERYPVELEGIVEEKEFKEFIEDVNSALSSHWPARITLWCAYLFLIMTVGLAS